MSPLQTASIVGAATLILASYAGGYRAGSAKVQGQWTAYKLQQEQSVSNQLKEFRAQEQAWAAANTELINRMIASERAVRDEYEATITDLNDGTLVLRQHYRGCQQQLSRTTPATGMADGGGGGGLPEADQRSFIRIGKECDTLAVKVQAFQAYAQQFR